MKGILFNRNYTYLRQGKQEHIGRTRDIFDILITNIHLKAKNGFSCVLINIDYVFEKG